MEGADSGLRCLPRFLSERCGHAPQDALTVLFRQALSCAKLPTILEAYAAASDDLIRSDSGGFSRGGSAHDTCHARWEQWGHIQKRLTDLTEPCSGW